MMGRYLNLFRFKYDSDSNKHSMFTQIGIKITMPMVVIPNYFPVLVSSKNITLLTR